MLEGVSEWLRAFLKTPIGQVAVMLLVALARIVLRWWKQNHGQPSDSGPDQLNTTIVK